MLNKTLSLAMIFTLTSTLSSYHTHAQNHHIKIEDSNPARMQVYIDDMSTPFAEFSIYSKTSTGDPQYRDFLAEDNGIIGGNEKDAIINSLTYLKELLGQPATTPTINLKLLDSVSGIASANSATIANGDTSLGEYFKNAHADNEHISLDGQQATINISCLSPQWYAGAYESIPHNGPYNFLTATYTHEMTHALGVYASTYASDDKFYLGETVYTNNQGDTALIINNFTKHLYDIYGTQAQVGMEIIPISIEEYTTNAVPRDPNKFYVFDRYYTNGSYQDLQFTSNSGISFRGDNVNAALTTDATLSSVPAINWADNYPVPPVYGVPLNGFELNVDENGRIYEFTEMAHLELQNSLLSHQLYRNWSTLMEAEIALLQDMGYDIDRKRFFGSSIYASGLDNFVNDKPYYARSNNAWVEGQASTQDWGVGLHVHGSNNKLTQTAPLLADGDYANGIRLDGQFNDLTIATKITANGKAGNGLLVSYGKKHNITLNQNASIIADGDGAVGARFDFGDNMLGQCSFYMESRGSYYRLLVADPNNRILETYPSLQGELVTSFNVNGHLQGRAAAIYISHNALVKNININEGASIKGNIISDWNPHTIPIDKIYRGEYTTLIDYRTGETISWDLELPEGENGLTNLNFAADLRYDYNISGKESIVANVKSNKLSFNGIADVCEFNVAEGATLGGNGIINLYDYNDTTHEYILGAGTLTNNGTVAPGNSIGTLTINGDYEQAGGATIDAEISGDGTSDKIIVNGNATINGTINLVPVAGYFSSDPQQATAIQIVENSSGDNSKVHDNANYSVISDNPILTFNVQDADNTGFKINVNRKLDAYKAIGNDALSSAIAEAFYLNADKVSGDAAKLVGAVEFAGSRDDIANAMKRLNPSVFHSSAQATLNTHNLLNSMNMLGSFSNNIPVPRIGGERGPAAQAATAINVKDSLTATTDSAQAVNAPTYASTNAALKNIRFDEPQHNSWRNIIMPFSAYTDQHSGDRGYTNHNSGIIGAMERTLDNGLTHGYHAALNHQSTSEGSSTIKGEGLYLGAQASYAPADWNGWSAFGSARLGVEQMRSHRTVFIPGATGGYVGRADADWTGYSGSLSIGTALTKEHGIMQSGPFAALDYSFAHRPSVNEAGDAVRTNLASESYDSLRTQLGYRLTTKPKVLDSYDSTQWQAHASLAWNHELLSDNGSTSYSLADLPGVTITDTAENYGRDSISIAAGLTFKTPKRLDVGLSLGSDIYRKGGSSIYGKVNLEWKF